MRRPQILLRANSNCLLHWLPCCLSIPCARFATMLYTYLPTKERRTACLLTPPIFRKDARERTAFFCVACYLATRARKELCGFNIDSFSISYAHAARCDVAAWRLRASCALWTLFSVVHCLPILPVLGRWNRDVDAYATPASQPHLPHYSSTAVICPTSILPPLPHHAATCTTSLC